jgi:hypothetical protein
LLGWLWLLCLLLRLWMRRCLFFGSDIPARYLVLDVHATGQWGRGLGCCYDLLHPLVFDDCDLLPLRGHALELGGVYEFGEFPAPHIGQQRVLVRGQGREWCPRHHRRLEQCGRLSLLWGKHWSGHNALGMRVMY